MQARAILIVEDELIIAEYLAGMLRRLGYQVVGLATRVEEARQYLQAHTIDLVLLDIMLPGELDGVDLAAQLQQHYQVPFIFITSLADAGTVRRAAATQPQGYLIKPFTEQDVQVALTLAFTRPVSTPAPSESAGELLRDSLFVRDRKQFVKVSFSDLLWLEADGNYTILHTISTKYTVYYTLKQLEEHLSPAEFIRVHRSYVVAIRAIVAFNAQGVTIRDTVVPVGRSYQHLLTQRLNLLGAL